MWKPFDFDPNKKYPIVSYVYPGPQTEPFPITFGASRHQALAQVGFIVVAFGNRGGSPLRSRYYHTYGSSNKVATLNLKRCFSAALSNNKSRRNKMKLTKKFAIGVAAAAALSAGSALAAYPEKPIKIMVGFSAGGGTETNLFFSSLESSDVLDCPSADL